MVDKFTKPPYGEKLVEKINEIIDSIGGSGGSVTSVNGQTGDVTLTASDVGALPDSTVIPSVDTVLSTTSTNPVQNKVVTTALNGKFDSFTLRFAGNWSGGVHAVNFVTVDYSECNSENGVFIKFSMVNSHGNGEAGRFLQDVILNVKHTGTVAGTLYRYFAVPIDQASSEYYGSHYYGDVFWVNDTTNKIVRFYVLMHQYSYTSQTPYFRLNASTKGVITQATGGAGASEYSTGTRVWTTINWFETDQTYSATSQKPQSGVAVASAISGKQDVSNLVTTISASSTNAQYPSAKCVNDALSGKQGTLIAGTGITINASNTIATTDPVLTNVATNSTSLTIWGNPASGINTINIGKYSSPTGVNSIMIGAYSSAGEGGMAFGNGAVAKKYSLAYLGSTSVNYAYQIGRGTNSETYSLYVGWGADSNYKLLDSTGYIPNARLNMDTTVTASSTNAVTSGAVSTAIANMQTTGNLVTSVSSASTDAQYPSAKLFYDTCGDIETLINAL